MTQTSTPATVVPPIVLLLSSSRDADTTVVSLRGEHDLATAHSLAAAIATAAALDHTDLVLDLSGVQFMDSTTIVVILRGKSLLAARGRTMTVRDPSRPARYVLGLCDLGYIVEAPPMTEAPIPGPDEDGAGGATRSRRRRLRQSRP